MTNFQSHDRQQPLKEVPRLRSRLGVTTIEVLIVVSVIGILMSLLLPAVQASRERARAITCRNNLRQLVLAAVSYESSQRAFPYTSTTWLDSSVSPAKRYSAISAHRCLMPFLDPAIGRKVVFDDPTDPGWLSTPPTHIVLPHRELQLQRITILLCPSDDGFEGATNYRVNHGISVHVLSPSPTIEGIAHRGAFVNGRAIPASDFRDGLSHTAFFSERVLGDRRPMTYSPFQDVFSNGQFPNNTRDFILHCQNDAVTNPPSEFSYAGASWLLALQRTFRSHPGWHCGI
jgi:type II secretory pathway pseudopilin PulG